MIMGLFYSTALEVVSEIMFVTNFEINLPIFIEFLK